MSGRHDARIRAETIMIKLPRAVLWTLAALLAVTFVYVGQSKLFGSSASKWQERFERWGYPAAASYCIGLLELAAGAGVLLPKARRAAAAVLIAVMIGALITHLINGEPARIIPPLVLGGLAALQYWSRPSPG
jgi:putative oxidoreductase